MALIIKDGSGASTNLKTTLSSSAHTPHHIVDQVSGTVTVTSSAGNPVSVTGTVTVSNPVDVNVTVADIISVTSSLAAPLFVSSSAGSPILVTGTVAINGITTVTSSAGNPVLVTGTVSAAISDGLKVELSGANVKRISGSATNTYLQVGIAAIATGSVRKRFAPAGYTGPQYGIDATFDWSTAASGTVCLASASVSRKSLTITNPTPDSLYISIGSDAWLTGTNGFAAGNQTMPPTEFSFIIYPSGTYFAEAHNVGMFHGGYMISGSNTGNRIFVTETY